jgi:hypothetical protein
MQNTHKLITLGRFMMRNAQRFQDDVKCNAWARVGQMLTELNVPFGIKWADLSAHDVMVVREAVAVVTGKQDMPTLMVQPEVVAKRSRKPRMTQVMSKPVVTAARDQKVAKKVSKSAAKMKVGKTIAQKTAGSRK